MRFDLGVGSFDPLTDRVLLWTRVHGGGDVRWVVGRDPSLHDVVSSGTASADAEPWTVTVDVDGLDAGTTYWYRFDADGEQSAVGRTRTLPDGGADRLRLGVACCARFSQATFAVYRALAAADVDLVVHLGDYVYEDHKDGVKGREYDPPHDAVTVADYRARYLQHRGDADLQLLHAAHPMVAVWDDHDFADNAWRGGSKAHDEKKQGPWDDRVAAAVTAHQEFVPKRLADAADPRSAWRSFDAGSLVRLVCTETRVCGRDEQAGLPGTLPADDPARSMLGDRQRSWLLPLVADPSPRWLVVVSGTVLSELHIAAPEELDRVMPEKYEVVDGCGINSDQWDGYPAERTKLAAALAARPGNIVLSGDIHSSWIVEGPRGPSGTPVAVELVCPPVSTTPLGKDLPGPLGRRLGPALQRHIDAARWVEVEQHGFAVVDIAADVATATFWEVDAEPGADGRPVRGTVWTTLAAERGRWHATDPGPEPDAGKVRRHGLHHPLRLLGTVRRRLARRR